MATVIDELIVTMGLDIKDLQKGVKQVQSDMDKTRKEGERTAKHLQETGKKAAEFFSQVRNSALAFFAVLTAGRGLATFTRDVVSSGANLSRLSKNLNANVTELSAWQNLVEQAGGSADGFQGTVRHLSDEAFKLAHTGKTDLAPFLQHFGINILDANRKALPFNQMLMKMGDALRGVGDRQEALNWAKQAGIDEGTFNLLMNSRKELEKQLEWQREHAAFSKEQADALERQQAKWRAFTQELQYKMLPVVERLLRIFEKLEPVIIRLADVSVPIITKIIDVFNDLDSSTDGMSTKVIVAIGLFRILGGGAILKGLMSLAGGLTGIGTAAGTAASVGLQAMLIALSRIAGVVALYFLSDSLNAGENEWSQKNVVKKYGKPLPHGSVVNPDGSVSVMMEISPETKARRIAEATSPQITSASSLNGKIPRGIRNNNPGNLQFAGQLGAMPEPGSGRFARFGSMQQGLAALYRQLQLYKSRGINTLAKLAAKYAPPNENDTGAYLARLVKFTGFGANSALDFSNPEVAESIIRGISRNENGGNYLPSGHFLVGARAAGSGGHGGNTTVSIGNVNIHTRATDAKGIARDFRSEIVAQANSGMR